MILILFDIDGTLVYTNNRKDSKSFAAAYESIYQQPFPTIDWHRFPHVTDTAIIQTVIKEAFDREPEVDEINHFRNDYIQRLNLGRLQNPEHYLEVPGAKKMVEWLLSRREFCVGIATGGWIKPAEIKLAHVSIPTGQFPISGADGHPTRESIINTALGHAYQRYDRFERIVYVGDALWDIQTTRNLSMNFVGIRRQNDLEVLQKAGAGCVLPNFLDRDLFLDAVLAANPPMEVAK